VVPTPPVLPTGQISLFVGVVKALSLLIACGIPPCTPLQGSC
jgi:hypothetical protein